VSLAERHIRALQKKARRGFCGFPVATIAYYGPDDRTASKVAVGIIPGEGQPVAQLQRWHSRGGDIRRDLAVFEEVLHFVRAHGAMSIALTDGIIGCPHEEGVDYPEGASCPSCPFWAERDRWAGQAGQ